MRTCLFSAASERSIKKDLTGLLVVHRFQPYAVLDRCGLAVLLLSASEREIDVRNTDVELSD